MSNDPDTPASARPRTEQVRTRVRTFFRTSSDDRWPRNIRPWTNTPIRLDDVRPAAFLTRMLEGWLWLIAHPQTRWETLDWHRRRRRNSSLAWRLRKLRATLRGQAPGPPYPPYPPDDRTFP